MEFLYKILNKWNQLGTICNKLFLLYTTCHNLYKLFVSNTTYSKSFSDSIMYLFIFMLTWKCARNENWCNNNNNFSSPSNVNKLWWTITNKTWMLSIFYSLRHWLSIVSGSWPSYRLPIMYVSRSSHWLSILSGSWPSYRLPIMYFSRPRHRLSILSGSRLI